MIFQERFQSGDLVYAARDLASDGEVPGTAEGEVLVPAGTRGMVVRVGHLENQPETSIYLVQFEDNEKNLGSPLGCLTEEITQRLASEARPG